MRAGYAFGIALGVVLLILRAPIADGLTWFMAAGRSGTQRDEAEQFRDFWRFGMICIGAGSIIISALALVGILDP
jgi:hypothetical protein